MLPLGEPHTRSTAIFGDEFDARSFKGPSNGRHHGRDGPALAGFEMDDGAQADIAYGHQLDLRHIEESAGSAALGGGDVHGSGCARHKRKMQ